LIPRLVLFGFILKWQWNTDRLLFRSWEKYVYFLAKDHWQRFSCPVNSLAQFLVGIVLCPLMHFILLPTLWWIIYIFTITKLGRMTLGLTLCWTVYRKFRSSFLRLDCAVSSWFRPVFLSHHVAIVAAHVPVLPVDVCRMVSGYLDF
jgi:hypothetical protein